MTIGLIQNALQGLLNHQRRAERAADDVVRSTLAEPGEGGPEYADAAVRLMTARRGFEASLAVARTADEMLGSVIDTLA